MIDVVELKHVREVVLERFRKGMSLSEYPKKDGRLISPESNN